MLKEVKDMTDTYEEYWGDDWGDYADFPAGLAQQMETWWANYMQQHVGVEVADGLNQTEETRIETYFSNWANIETYTNAMLAAPWYEEYMAFLADWNDGWDDDWFEPGDDDDFQFFDDLDLPLSEGLAQTIWEWSGEYIQAVTGINTLDGVSDSEEATLEGYFSSPNNIQAYVEAMMAAPWFQQWESVYNKAVADGRVDDADNLFADWLDDGDDQVELWDDDGSLWDAQIARPDGVVITAEEAQLYRAYAGAMGRTPDKAGYEWWLGEIETGRQDLNSMAGGFIHSNEFKDLVDINMDGVISNAEFVNHMYEGVFERAPDQAGFDYWVGELDAGHRSQTQAFIEMTQSDEYVQKTYMTVADMLLV